MPNYVNNILKVYGDKNRLIKFVERHITSDEKGRFFDFNTIIPQPKYRAEAGSKYFFNSPEEAEKAGILWDSKPELFDWYHWRIDHWNTKWNADGVFNRQIIDRDSIYQYDVGMVVIVFDTAWAAPVPVVEQLINWYHKNLRVSLDYYSFENMEAGCVWWDSYNNVIVHDHYDIK